MSDLKINIHGRNDNTTITDREYPKFEQAASILKPTGGSRVSKNVRVVFDPSAVSVLFDDIRWGRKYERGDVEQAGILLGNYYRDSSGEDEVIWGYILAVIPADPTLVNASFETIDITTAAWQKMHEEAAPYRSENLQILGWYHTHLSHISTRFSALDIRTQKKAFTYEYSFGIVFNPNQKKWAAFYGAESEECVGEIVFDEALDVKYGEPKIKIMGVRGDSELKDDGTVVHYDEEGRPIEPEPAAVSNRLEISRMPQIPPQMQMQPRESLGFFQRAGRFMDSILAPRPQSQRQQHSEARTSSTNATANSRSENRSNKPQISLGKVNKNNPTIRYRYFSLSLENELTEHPNFGCKIKADNIIKIVQHKRKKASGSEVFWGQVRGNSSNMELFIVAEQIADTKIIFSHNPTNKVTQIVGMGFQRTSDCKIKYIVIINDANPQEIEVQVMHYSKGSSI